MKLQRNAPIPPLDCAVAHGTDGVGSQPLGAGQLHSAAPAPTAANERRDASGAVASATPTVGRVAASSRSAAARAPSLNVERCDTCGHSESLAASAVAELRARGDAGLRCTGGLSAMRPQAHQHDQARKHCTAARRQTPCSLVKQRHKVSQKKTFGSWRLLEMTGF